MTKPDLTYGTKLNDFKNAWEDLKLFLPNLKTCILTLHIFSLDECSWHEGTPGNFHILEDNDAPFPEEFLTSPVPNQSDKTYSLVLAEIIGDFAETNLATHKFARIVHNLVKDGTRQVYYGPMVLVRRTEESGSHDASLGARLLG